MISSRIRTERLANLLIITVSGSIINKDIAKELYLDFGTKEDCMN